MAQVKETVGGKGAKPLKKKEVSAAIKAYLVGYNLVQTIGWSLLFFQFLSYYLNPGSKSLYETVKCSLFIFQNAAVLEVVHASTRIVPSNPVITAFQVASRVFVVCGVLYLTQAAKDSFGLPLALTAWCVTEIIRYSNYTLNLLNSNPFLILWLRYTTFIILYPIGITGELLCIFAASQEVARTKALSIELPNSLNFSFNYRYFLYIVMFSYIPIFPRLYLHMFAQRIRILGRVAQKTD